MSMPDPPAMLAYAVPADDLQIARRARRMLAAFTLAYAAVGIASLASFRLLKTGLVRSSINFAPDSPVQWTSEVVNVALMLTLAAAASAMLNGGSRGVLLLRYAAGLAAVAGTGMQLYWRFAYPGGGGAAFATAGDWLFAAVGTASSLFSVPAFICAMTFPLRPRGRG